MRKIGLFVLALVIAIPAWAQVRFPRVSQKATVMQSVGLTDITISYSRPGVKGRTIWGDLVPYDKVWRSGANEATTINFSEDVWIDGKKLAKGTYSIHTVPGKSQWQVILNSVADQWGSYSYDQSKDVVRFNVTPQKAQFTEWLTYEFPDVQSDKATIALRWENVSVPFVVETKTTEKVIASVKNAMSNAWQTPYR
ncbi:MAG TPA: DUF2911 domain-containing protein, partial [Thermoanaerobaculia bacterium]|nr:DUF2911 domain-containing protein [Thermoanaerobaculia bacterium]